VDYKTAYPYVDAFYHPTGDKRPKKWKRYLWKDVQKEVIGPAHNQNCFTTVQWFREAVNPGNREMEVHYGGFFLDFDARSKNFGGSKIKALEAAQKDTISVVEVFKSLGVEEPHIRVWYSGSKGFHILVMPEALGITPSKHNTYIMKLGALEFVKGLNLITLDLSIYSMRRMWRIPNSIHQTSGLFKVELYHSELGQKIRSILSIAKSAREDELYPKEEYEGIKPDPAAAAMWGRLKRSYEDQMDLERLKPKKPVIKTDQYPACVQDILLNGLKKDGTRNRATMALASYFKDVGAPKEESLSVLLGWVKTLPGGSSKTREREANTKAVIDTIYNSDSYHFACQYIRALSSGDNKVACTERDPDGCRSIENNPENQRPAETPRVPLSKASEAVFIGRKVTIPVMVTGKADSPYIYPKKVILTCTPDLETPMCASCAIAHNGGTTEVNFQMQNQVLIDLINRTSSSRNAIIKHHMGVPFKCYGVSVDVDQWGNLEEVRLQPDIQNAGLIDSRANMNDDASLDVIEEGTYCQRLGYYIGHDVGINKKYEITTYVWGHPKDQKVCHLFDQAVPSQDDIDKFRMNREIYRMLKAFQPSRGQSIAEKFDEIHDDLENTVHMIWQRREVAIALDLSYHSVIGFTFQSQYEKKGWIELLILGDSGNGKTKLVERMMNHYQLGEITGVEGGKRTGLIWANHNIGGRYMLTWGKIPQNDRRLIVLDEFSGMPDEEVATMTRLRTEGVAESQGINPAQTSARTRMVFLSNAKNGKPLNHYNYGIEAVNRLFKEHQDVRRLDLAVCVQSGDVPLEVINKKHTPDFSKHTYTTALCKNLILWAWSRDPRQVKFMPGSEDKILKESIRLGKKYRCDIVLVEPSDQRLKIARLAAAAAARVFSTSNGKDLEVFPEHVEYAVKFVERVYDHRAMQYDVYARNKQTRMFMSPENAKKLRYELEKLENPRHLVGIFLTSNYFRKGELADLTGYDKNEIGDLLKLLSKSYCIEATTGGYRKNPMFTEFLKKWQDEDGPPQEDNPDRNESESGYVNENTEPPF